MSSRMTLTMKAILGNAVISFVLMFVVNYFIVPEPATLVRTGINNGISAAIAAAGTAFVVLMMARKAAEHGADQ